MYIFQNNQLNNPAIQHAQALWLFPSLPTIRRYVIIQNMFGHVRPCRRTGNKRAVVLRDHNIIFLVLYRIDYPKCSAPQINAFLYRVNYGDVHFRFYTHAQITKAEFRVGMTRKRGIVQLLFKLIYLSILGRDGCIGTCRIHMELLTFE